MSKEKFDRSKPHVNIGTMGHELEIQQGLSPGKGDEQHEALKRQRLQKPNS